MARKLIDLPEALTINDTDQYLVQQGNVSKYIESGRKRLYELQEQYVAAGYPIAGNTVDGCTLTEAASWILHSDYTVWKYTGSFPFTATAGTVPSEPTYQAVHVKSHNYLTDRNAVGAHDAIYRRQTTVAEVESGMFIPTVGNPVIYLTIADRANASFNIVSGGTPNGTYILDAGNGNTAVYQLPHDGVVWAHLGADKLGVEDSTTPIKDSLVLAVANTNKTVRTGEGKFRFTENVEIPKHVIVQGDGYSTSPDTAATILLKDGNFNGISVLDAAQLRDVSVEGVAGNGGDGVALLGGRAVLQNVSSFNHGRDGFKFGAYFGTANNSNLWRAFNLISESNGRHGLYASDDNDNYNCNAGMLSGYDCSNNGGDGLHVKKAGNNSWYGVTCQVNDGYGIYVEGTGNFFAFPYLEANVAGEAYYDADSTQNMHLFVRSGVNNGGITNLNDLNIIIDRNSRFESFFTTLMGFIKLSINEGGSSGNWVFEKDAGRNLLLDLLNTSGTANLWIGSNGREHGIKLSDGDALKKVKNQSVTLNFGTVPANGTTDATFSMSGIDSNYTLSVTPFFTLPSGVIITAYWNGTNAVARCANLTGSPVSVSGACRLTAIKIGA
jgi:hypothetical protein